MRDEGRVFREGDAKESVLYEGWNLEGKRVRWEAVQERGFEGRLFRNGVGGEAVQERDRRRGCSVRRQEGKLFKKGAGGDTVQERSRG
jgi:hypothetical protein